MAIEIIDAPVTLDSIRRMASRQFGDFVKAVVDVERGVMAIGDSMINVRPLQNNRSRGVDDASLRGRIQDVIGRLIVP
jgi:hypothetical protein